MSISRRQRDYSLYRRGSNQSNSGGGFFARSAKAPNRQATQSRSPRKPLNLPKFRWPGFPKISIKWPKLPSRGPRTPREPRAPRNEARRKQIWQWVGLVCLTGFCAGTLGMIILVAVVSRNLPKTGQFLDRVQAQTTTIYDRTGETILYQIYGEQKRTFKGLGDISDFVKKGTVAAEDKVFYEHKGISPKGMLRGFLRNLTREKNENLQSGSTITQQLVKKIVFTDKQSYIRKVKEIILAIQIERKFSKDQILEMYLNEIPYGSVSYGIESAAQTFFGKAAKDLTLSESAILVSLPNGPTLYSPYGSNTEGLLGRQHYVITRMLEDGYITQEQADEAKADDVLARIKPKRENITAPHFVFYVKQLLAQEYGDDVVERGGLKVYTTLDMDKQNAAEQAIKDGMPLIEKWEGSTAALAAINAKNGDILAMVGSADYFNNDNNGQFNSLLGRLQPGSSIKPIVYAAAFEKGYTPSTVVEDVKTEFSTSATSYSPNNYNFKEHGPITLKSALAGSLNIPAVKALYLTGFDKFEDFAGRIGYTTFKDRSSYGLSLVLGGAVVKPLEHINAYTAFAQDGVYHPSRAILKVIDKDGKVLEEHGDTADGKKAFDPEVARQINDIMSDNAARAYIFGEKNYLTLPDRPVAAKTGTTNNNKDAWTVGFTPSLVAGVWVGDAKGEQMKAGADGSVVAAPIWNAFMRKALAGTKAESFTPPQPVATGKPVLDGDIKAQATFKVDRISGKLATEFTPPEYVEERRYGAPHTILHFVNKDDPRGPAPENPAADPQYANWEKGLAEWLAKQTDGEVIDTTTLPPTEYDDVHTADNKPSITITSPSEGAQITDRAFRAEVSSWARRGVTKYEYLIDDEYIGSTGAFDSAPVTIPNRIPKGFHKLTIKAVDDVGNFATASVTVNITADAGPLGIEWKQPYHSQSLNLSQFPYEVMLHVGDYKNIAHLEIIAISPAGESIAIGSVDTPPLPNLSFRWERTPLYGKYDLTVNATFKTGESRMEVLPVYVQQ